VAVQAVFGNINFGSDKPFYFWGFEIPFYDLCPRFIPLELAGLLCPEPLRVVDAALVYLVVFFKGAYLSYHRKVVIKVR
jgi:hypothetical protein